MYATTWKMLGSTGLETYQDIPKSHGRWYWSLSQIRPLRREEGKKWLLEAGLENEQETREPTHNGADTADTMSYNDCLVCVPPPLLLWWFLLANVPSSSSKLGVQEHRGIISLVETSSLLPRWTGADRKIDHCMRGRRLPKAGERTSQKDEREGCLVLTQGWKWCLFPPVRLKKLIIHEALSRVLTKVLPQSWAL